MPRAEAMARVTILVNTSRMGRRIEAAMAHDGVIPETLVILVAGPFMLILIAMCVSLMKALRQETFESTLYPRVRRAVQHAERYPDGP
mgnify:CR=1 FL=1